MKNSFMLIFASLLLTSACVKEEGSVSSGGSTQTTSGSGDGTSGSTQQPGVEDPLAAYAWHLENNAQTTFATTAASAGEDVSVRSVIESGITGLGVRIAVSDSGTDIEHEDLSGNQLVGEHRDYFIASPNLWRTSLPHYIGDDAHGTATVGLIAALGWNGLGSRGVAPKAKYAAFRYVGNYTSTPSSQLARDIDQTDGNFDIFNYSYGYPQCYFIEENELALEAFKDGVTNLRNGLGSLYVQSAGNDYNSTWGRCEGSVDTTTFAGNSNHSDDTAIPEKIVVGAVNAAGVKSSYSTPGSSVWVSAPGGEDGFNLPAMLTTDISGCSHGYSFFTYAYNAFNRGSSSLNTKCNYTALMNGTSSAAPVVSGVIALMLEANPILSWRDVKHIIALTSDEVNSVDDVLPHPRGISFNLAGHDYDYRWITNGAGLRFSNWYGFGRINAARAVNMAKSYPFPLGGYETTTNPTTDEWYYDSGVIGVNIPDYSASGTLMTSDTTLEVSHNFIVESVQVEVNIDHPAPQDLAITLISPGTTESRLLTINSNVKNTSMPTNKLLLSNAFYGETSAGEWKIHVVDGGGDSPGGTLTNWRIKINGHKVEGDGSYPASVTNMITTGLYGSRTSTPPINFTPSASVDVVRYEVSVGTSLGLQDIAGWTSIGLDNTNVQLRNLRLILNKHYYVGIRAIDNRENASGVVYATWKVN